MTSRSMLDVAFDTLKTQGQEMPFLELWKDVSNSMGFTPAQAEAKIAQFYSALMLDVRFAPLADNVWDLRSRRTFNETHMDTSNLIVEEEELLDDESDDVLSDDEAKSNDDEDDI